MELKKAAAVCLIAFFAATLVVLIARALDQRAMARIESKLDRILAENRSLREGGGSGEGSGQGDLIDEGLIVYYFHGHKRCPTCESIEQQTRETIDSDFGQQLEDGQIVWQTLDYEEPSNETLVAQFGIQIPVVVLARVKAREIADSRRLDKVWALVGNREAFHKYIQDEVNAMIADHATPPSGAEESTGSEENVIPAAGEEYGEPSTLPIP